MVATSLCLIAQLCPTLCNPMDCSPSGSSVHGDSSGKNTGTGCHCLLHSTEAAALNFEHWNHLESLKNYWCLELTSKDSEFIGHGVARAWAFQVTLVAKNLLTNAGDVKWWGFNPWVGKIPLRKAWQPTSVFLPEESPWTEEPGGLQSMGSQRVGNDWVTSQSVFLA